AYAGRELAPAAFPDARAASRRDTPRSLDEEVARLAVESLRDGCLDEGFSAAVAREAHDAATDGAVRAALAVIARDEARHEALAWEIVAWCVERGAAGAVRRAADELARAAPLAGLESGRLSAARTSALHAEKRAVVVERARSLTSSPGARRSSGTSCP